MAAVTHRVSTADTSNTTSYTSGSFTPANGELLVCAVVAVATIVTPTLTDSLGGTWTLAASKEWSGTANEIWFFVRNALIGTGAAMTVTFDCTGDSATGVVIEVAGVSGMTKTGATALLQSAGNKNGAATTPATTFGAAAQTGNPTLVFLGNSTSPAGVTVPAGWTQRDNTGFSTPSTGGQYVSRDSGFTGTTITWGSTSSIWGALAVELDASAAATTVLPGVGALALTGFAPTVLTPQKVLPGLGQLVLTGFAPTVLTPRVVQTGLGQLVLTGFAPTVLTPQTVLPGVGALTLTGFAPTVLTPQTVQTGLGQLVLTGFAPTVVVAPVGSSVLAQPGVGALTLTGFAPTVLTPQKVLPGVGALILTGFAPTVLTPRVVQPGLGVLTLTGFAPTVVIAPTSTVLAQPGTGGLTLTGFAPTVVIAPARNASGWHRILYTEDEPKRRRRKKRPEDELVIEVEPLKGPGLTPVPVPRETRPLTGLPGRPTVVVVELDEDDDEEALMVLMHLLAELD